jgi:hypothetical protein
MSEHDDERPAEVLRTKRLVTGAEMSESMPGEMRALLLSISRTSCGANASLCCSRSWRPRREAAVSVTMSEKEIP